MKTAMQVILERAQDGINCHEKAMDNPKNSNIEKNRHSYLLNVCIMFKNIAIEQLESEKQQIINARIDGVAKSLNMDPEIVDRNASALYYEQTYLTNKETLK